MSKTYSRVSQSSHISSYSVKYRHIPSNHLHNTDFQRSNRPIHRQHSCAHDICMFHSIHSVLPLFPAYFSWSSSLKDAVLLIWLPWHTNIIQHSPPSVIISIGILTTMVHPVIPLTRVSVIQQVKTVRSRLQMNPEATHAASRSLRKRRVQLPTFFPLYSSVYLRHWHFQIKSKLQDILTVKDRKGR